MSDSELKLYLEKLLKKYDFIKPKLPRLVMIFGLLGDFDSFEYVSNAIKYQRNKSNKTNKELDLVVIAIGTEEGKKQFCKFTGLPQNNLIIVEDNKIHKDLGISCGLDIGLGGWINMILMLSGIGSPMTIKEVIRGYTGDKNSDQIFDNNDQINLFNIFKFSGSLFNKSFGENYLRPLELATFRLNNMIEIIKNWNDYIPNTKYLPQRGASFLINKDNEIIYKYFSTDLLCYSENINSPMNFLNNYLN